jgi:MSHA biogenesis protein MshP
VRRPVRFSPAGQQGFALVAAIFLLVVVAALGAFAVRTSMSQQFTTDLQLLTARAQADLEAAVEIAAVRLAAVPRVCANLPPAPVAMPDGFSIVYGPCTQRADVEGVTPVDTFTIRISATHGNYGDPDFVSRSATVRIAL